jgi:poly-gamma-glutamate synthesis protein (capsule biosynthesis protein)
VESHLLHRKSHYWKTVLLLGVVSLAFSGCAQPAGAVQPQSVTAFATDPVVSNSTSLPTRELSIATQAAPAATETHTPLRIWLSPAVPQEVLAHFVLPAGAQTVSAPGVSSVRLAPFREAGEPNVLARWVYAAVAPFPTIVDEINLDELEQIWQGTASEAFTGPLLVTAEVHTLFAYLWGQSDAAMVQVIPVEEMVEQAWAQPGSLAIVRFEALEPRWKVLRIDGASPLDDDFDLETYPLSIAIGLSGPEAGVNRVMEEQAVGADLVTNRDPSRMTVLTMTGVTALVRRTALRMEEEGVLYPGENVGELLRSADLTHISNEASFWQDCPPGKPLQTTRRFCSSPGYLDLLLDAGVDLIELTGNHMLDFGVEPFLETLELYADNDLPVYGAGINLDAARQPLLLEHNGNHLAFIGCNAAGPENHWATQDEPGIAACDMDWLTNEIMALRAQGYLPVATFQHFEFNRFPPQSQQRRDFLLAAEAGAEIVSGSQAHYPQTFAFVEGRLVHYGLGNLFFDQMTEWNRRAFIDRHVIYDGRLISTELLTVILEDYSQPRLMTGAEREVMLYRVFKAAGWLE